MADSRIYLQSQPLLPIGNTTSAAVNTGKAQKTDGSFADFLSQVEKRLTFSQHALERMQSRNLDFSAQDMVRLRDTVDKMAQKGARESLIYLNDIALVVSVTNKTVITAMDSMSAKDNIFTNIDSAAIL
jgi:flagellar operon protein